MEEFWDDMQWAFVAESGMDSVFMDQSLDGDFFKQVKEEAEKEGIALPVKSGTRVSFVANLSSVLTYPDVPDPSVKGTVVTVRTAGGDSTLGDGRLFILWDDGKFRPMCPEHVRLEMGKTAKSVRMVTSDLDSISTMFVPAMDVNTASGNDLVHKTTRDLWSVKQEGGEFLIERLFDGDGNPLKV